LEAHTNVKLEDPKNFSEIKSFYYTNLFEEVCFEIRISALAVRHRK